MLVTVAISVLNIEAFHWHMFAY